MPTDLEKELEIEIPEHDIDIEDFKSKEMIYPKHQKERSSPFKQKNKENLLEYKKVKNSFKNI